MKDKINDMVILFLDKQFKNKKYTINNMSGGSTYRMDSNLYFTYNSSNDSFESSGHLDNIILKYMPKYYPYNSEILVLINDWCQKNLPKK